MPFVNKIIMKPNKITIILVITIILICYAAFINKKETSIIFDTNQFGDIYIKHPKWGFSITVNDNQESIIINLGLEETFALGLTKDNKIKNFILDKINKNGDSVIIKDANADGLPELKMTYLKNKKELLKEYFYKGRFYSSEQKTDGSFVILVDGNEINVNDLY